MGYFDKFSRTYRDHYDYLKKNLRTFFENLEHPDAKYCEGLIGAHGDKCYTAWDTWQEAGLHPYHGTAIYLLTYVRPYAQEVREYPEEGWVQPRDWVLANKDRFLPFLPPVEEPV